MQFFFNVKILSYIKTSAKNTYILFKEITFSVCATYKSLAKSLIFSQFSTWYRKIEYDTP